MPSTCSPRRSRPARWSARPRCARWRSSTSWSRCGAACTAAPSATSAAAATWTRRSPSARWSSARRRYSFQAGAGIVADSVPATEYDEVLAKSAVLRARAGAGGGGAMKPRLLLIDNYDSFTYNLVQAFLVLGAEVLVHRNDADHDGRGAGARADAPVHLARARARRGRGRLDGDDRAPSPGACRCSACASGTSRWSRCSAARSCARRA